MAFTGGGGVEKLSPRVREQPLEEAISTIPYETLAAFLSRSVVLDKDQIDDLPYIVAHREGLISSTGRDAYARRIDRPTGSVYNLVHLGDELYATHSAFTRPALGEAGLLEISAGGVNKATMLAYCCSQLGIDAADVAGFGDMPNDVDMLSWVGMPYVVANAHPSLREHYRVVPSNAESGVGRTILGWL